MKLTKTYKIIASVAGFMLIVQVFMFSIQGMGSGGFSGVQKLIEQDADDQRIAAELSNMTGISTEDIMALKRKGMTWNEVIEYLKTQKPETNQDERNLRLAEAGLDKDYIQNLKDEGYSDQKIMEAKLLVERTRFQLNQIIDSGRNQVSVPSVEVEDLLTNKEDDDLTAYIKVAEKFDVEKAIYLILRLEQDFGSMESVLDEYLFSLQAELDLELYVQDKEKYQEIKKEKTLIITEQDIITLTRIENKMLEVINKENQKMSTELDDKIEDSILTVEENDNQPLPDIPTINVEDVKPKNPAEELMEEIQVIDPNQN